MTMSSMRFFSLTIALAVATFVASAFAQQPAAHPKNKDAFPGQDTTGRLAQLDLVLESGPSKETPLQKLWSEEQSLAAQANRLTKQLEAADTDAKRDDAKAKLREVLGKQFDARQKRHGLEIEA